MPPPQSHGRERVHARHAARPRRLDADQPLLDFTSGYIQRAAANLPRQGARAPWRLYQNYVRDLLLLRFGRVDEKELEFARAPKERVAPRPEPELAAANTNGAARVA